MKFLLIITILYFNVFALTYDPNSDKIKYYPSVDKEMKSLYIQFNSNLILGDLNEAKLNLNEMSKLSKSINYQNEIGLILYDVAKSKIKKKENKIKESQFHINKIIKEIFLLPKQTQNFLVLDLYEDIVKVKEHKKNLSKFMKSNKYLITPYSINKFDSKKTYNIFKYNYILNLEKHKKPFKKEPKKNKIYALNNSKLELSILTTFGKDSPEFFRFKLSKAMKLKKLGELKTAYSSIKNLDIEFEDFLSNTKHSKTNELLADIYKYKSILAGSLKYYKELEESSIKSINIYKDLNLSNQVLESYSNLIYEFKFSNIKKAFFFHKEAMKYILSLFDKKSEFYSFFKITESDLHVANNQYQKALDCLNEIRPFYIEKYGEYSKELKLIDLNRKYITKTISDIKWGM